VCISFCIRLAQIATGTFEMLKNKVIVFPMGESMSVLTEHKAHFFRVCACMHTYVRVCACAPIFFFFVCKITHHEFVPPKHIVKKHFYVVIL
jgi:hypothetical protein